jgi:hypothetical protein
MLASGSYTLTDTLDNIDTDLEALVFHPLPMSSRAPRRT